MSTVVYRLVPGSIAYSELSYLLRKIWQTPTPLYSSPTSGTLAREVVASSTNLQLQNGFSFSGTETKPVAEIPAASHLFYFPWALFIGRCSNFRTPSDFAEVT